MVKVMPPITRFFKLARLTPRRRHRADARSVAERWPGSEWGGAVSRAGVSGLKFLGPDGPQIIHRCTLR